MADIYDYNDGYVNLYSDWGPDSGYIWLFLAQYRMVQIILTQRKERQISSKCLSLSYNLNNSGQHLKRCHPYTQSSFVFFWENASNSGRSSIYQTLWLKVWFNHLMLRLARF